MVCCEGRVKEEENSLSWYVKGSKEETSETEKIENIFKLNDALDLTLLEKEQTEWIKKIVSS